MAGAGKRGPAPKPTALRLLHGDDKPSRVNRNEVRPRQAIPDKPDWLEARASEVWDRAVAELVHMKLLTVADGDALAVYCQAVAHYEQAVKLVASSGLLIRGRKGEVVKNPAMQFVRDGALLIRTMAAQFGFTPASRVGMEPQDNPHAIAGPERLLS